MKIFQKSVIQKHLKSLDKEKVEKAFQAFRLNYNPAKIEQIKTLKEEEYQDGFLREIFVDVLGYTLRPDENFDLQREFKNQTDGKKADGAIIKDENAIAVIELKSTKTKDLTKITQQAFNYKNNQPECKYIITSNFQKLRFYIDYSTEFEEFDLFFLDRERFELLYLILHKESVFSNLPIQLKKETQFHEKEISEELYNDYSHFKDKLFHNLIANHPDNDKLLLFKKSQKLLDRFLFILFAEDSGLLPPNSISRIIKRFDILKEEDAYKPIYEIFKQYFGYMNIGRPGKKESDNIPAYNGGLFYEDLLLNNLNIDDDILIDDLKKLSTYDFNTEVDVNILGHIFEHSLNEIEEVTAEIEGTVSDRKRTKRKKDGVFYTPKYITTYIVANTIGKLCIDKRKELDIEEIEFDDTFLKKDLTLTVKGRELFKTLTDYKNWLTNLKIIDPACGSGAFLNQALNFLIEEHEKIDDIIADLTNSPLRLFDTDKNILENNLFGVDINEESVEIAQLSLWLRTAKKDRKLSKLNSNIKCGNSLLTSEFDWYKEFPHIMKNGGFDVVIGNPPYIKEYTNRQAFDGLHNNPCYQGKMDLWYFFGALALDIIKKDYGLIGYIAPNNWITNSGASKFRNIVLNKGKLTEFIDFGDFKVFDSAGIQTMIYIMQSSENNENYNFNFSKVNDSKIKHEDAQLFLERVKDEKFEYFKASIDQKENIDKPINFVNAELTIIVDKIKAKQNFDFDKKEIAQGIVAPQDFLNKKNQAILGDNFKVGDGIFNITQREYESLNLTAEEKKIVKPFYTTTELHRFYGTNKNRLWVIYTDSSFNNAKKIEPYPNLKEHLDKFQEVITSSNKPYGLHRAREEKFFNGEKIISLRKCARPTFTFTDFDCYVSQTYFSIQTERLNQRYLTGLLNSNLLAFWLKYQGKMQGDLYQVDKEPLMNLPIVNPKVEIQEKVADLVSSIISNTQKTSDYQELLNKAKTENNFDREIQLTKELEQLATELEKTESKINSIFYELYEIEPNEIATIEKNINL
ncbi:Eco57I restriction-modification methylase domain-containing protein [Sunxiuqinia elliptica]|uniref:site-specific DNA-methyltransferase (adenine-specific) n=1 Tax=Sunxiuqinia elliptica TaxID=655355 RepID=A0A4R6H2F1_9BACT|nr:N-6 DNA methylase [Sunxiuqinia elliptica]TDO01455.1 TaqI restriction endonuclease [Sunxiuqinia elliptica]TDO57966.1 TaqI restriction endonuclease [Sunxiuqinia elliptica]